MFYAIPLDETPGIGRLPICPRPATRSQNVRSRPKYAKAGDSKYKGISWRKKTRNWQAGINFEKKTIHTGCFRSEIDAAKAYDEAAIKYHGEFAGLNSPDSAVRPRHRWFGI